MPLLLPLAPGGREARRTKPPGASAPDVTGQGAPAVKKLRPVIVIDAGHGGIDPGASGPNNITEKAIVFAVAQQLEGSLESGGALRRENDPHATTFSSPSTSRLKMSTEVGADLFISLHADSIAEKAFAENIRGATVYTLSERASDEQARLHGRKGKRLRPDSRPRLRSTKAARIRSKNILIDLMRRETSNFSADFSNLLVKRLVEEHRRCRAIRSARRPSRC